ncbi:MAG TPA: S8 family serine peptidase, partial [Dongiaceae bacterium]|nr:S8 family serine peptidase [Dongiaceae bacterium]
MRPRAPRRLAALLPVTLAAILTAGAIRAGATAPAIRPDDGAGGGAVVGNGVVEALATGGSVRVFVYLDRPSAAASGAGAIAAEAAAPGPAAAAAARDRDRVARAQDEALGALGRGEFTVRRRFARVPAFAGDLTAAGLERLRRAPGVRRIDLDLPGRATLAQSVPLINADDVQALGFTGDGVTVAIIDSGVDTDHPDLVDDIVAQACFCSTGGACCPNGQNVQIGPGAAEDQLGHGTHVAGIITAKGVVSAKGVAPDAGVIVVKVMGASGTFCCSSDVVAGLDWILDNHPEVKAINMSLGSFALYPGDCDAATAENLAYADVIDALRAHGTTSFAAAGNDASGNSMSAPGCIAGALSVGSVYDANIGGVGFGDCSDPTTAADKVSCFSNSDSVTDIFAPGGAIRAPYLGGSTATLFGTSMATPHGVGCAAILYDAVPTLTPATLEANLEATGVPVIDPKNGRTFPRIDCLAALNRMLACVDADGDGAGAPGVPACPRGPVTDCDDGDASSYPGRVEVCDGRDNDCNGIVDDAALPDADGDGRGDCYDNCPAVPNPAQANADGDARGDACDPCPLDAADDVDGDGRCANLDNCPLLANPDQADLDQDGQGDFCDPDDGVRFMRWTSPSILTWDADSGDQRFDLYRGLLKSLTDADHDGAADSYGACAATDLTTPQYADAAVPPLGDGFLYIATGLTG